MRLGGGVRPPSEASPQDRVTPAEPALELGAGTNAERRDEEGR
jgi:hypothetical protein